MLNYVIAASIPLSCLRGVHIKDERYYISDWEVTGIDIYPTFRMHSVQAVH